MPNYRRNQSIDKNSNTKTQIRTSRYRSRQKQPQDSKKSRAPRVRPRRASRPTVTCISSLYSSLHVGYRYVPSEFAKHISRDLKENDEIAKKSTVESDLRKSLHRDGVRVNTFRRTVFTLPRGTCHSDKLRVRR